MTAVHDSAEAQREYQRRIYDRHFSKRTAAVRSQLAHPLFRSFNDRVAGRILDVALSTRASPDQGPVRIFELGCGEGLVGSALGRVAAERQIDMLYTGADQSASALDLARSAVEGELHAGDAAEVAARLPAGSQDIVVAKNLLHHLPDPAAFLREVTRVLAPGGKVIAFEARLGCPQFLLFSVLANRRERYHFSGQRRNAAAFKTAGYRVVSADRFSWLPYELAFLIRPGLFRRLFSTADQRAIARISKIDDQLAATLPWFSAYVVWVATRDSATQ